MLAAPGWARVMADGLVARYNRGACDDGRRDGTRLSSVAKRFVAMSPTRSLARVVVTLVCTLVLPTGAARLAGAQTLGGQVVQLDTKKPLGGAAVALVNDSAEVVATTSASEDGAFYLDAPAAGVYRLVVFVSGASFVSPMVQLDSGKTLEREFSVPDVPLTFASTRFARDVTRPATPVPGNRDPIYPPELVQQGVRAVISTMFVVDSIGQPVVSTLRVLSAAPNERFVDAIREALPRTRFVPANKDGDWVPQVVQYTYDFGFQGDPDRGDVVVRAPAGATLASSRETRAERPLLREPRSPVKTMYVLRADELSHKEIGQMNLYDALLRLRPRLFDVRMQTTKSEVEPPPIYVNDVRVEGMSSLREILASHVEEVRYWKQEEAYMKYGLVVPFALTVRMLPGRS